MRRRLIVALSLILIVMAFTACGSSNDATAEVSISNLEYKTSNYNKNINDLTFDFTNDAGETFSVFAGGLRDIDSPDDMAYTIGSHFAGGSASHIEGNLIDAEKYGAKDNSSRNDGNPYGDANLCWAASVADMLVYGGWTDKTEDEEFSFFTENFFDEGCFHDTGIKFWMNGVNSGQSAAEDPDSNGCINAVFIQNESSDMFSSTQARNPGNNGNKIANVGKLKNYAAENVYRIVDGNYTGLDEFKTEVVDALKSGKAVGVDLVFYKGESRVGVHALTAFGCICNSEGKLVALLISDSDNDINLKSAYGESAESTLSDRAARTNSYDMFLTGSFEHNDKEFLTLQDYKYSNPKMKYDNAVIQQGVILDPKSSSNTVEHEGTRDAANTIDIVLSKDNGSLESTSFKKGDKVKLPVIISNRSYTGVSTREKAVAKCRCIIKKDGKEIDSVPFEVKFVTDSYVTGEANCSFSVSCAYEFDQTGRYSVDFEVLGLYSGKNGGRLAEAYTSNNYLRNAVCLEVK